MDDNRPDAIPYWQDGPDAQSIAPPDSCWAVISRSGLCFVSVGFVYGCFGAGVTALSMRPLLLPPVSFQAVTITYAHSELPTTAGREVAAAVTLLWQDRFAIALEAVSPNPPEALILDGPFDNRPHHTTSNRSGQPSEGSAIYHLFSTSAYGRNNTCVG
jgi:hypothetical protein